MRASSYAYSGADQLTTLTYPGTGTEAVTTAYNPRGLPQSLIGASTYVSSVTYDVLPRPRTLFYGDASQSNFTYELPTTRLVAFNAPGTSISEAYAYDNVGNLTCWGGSSQYPCSALYVPIESFTYDAQNRLTAMSRSLVPNSGSYAYDTTGLGELTTKNEAGSSASLTYSAAVPVHAPKSVNGTSYSYDKAGNLLSRGSTSYTYDWQNHLTQVSQNGSLTQFLYDGDGHLAQRTDPSGTKTDYIGEIYEKTSTGIETKRYSLGSSLVATRVGGVLSYLHPNFLHSTVSSSSSVWARYAPYGLIQASAGTLPTDRQFQGQQNQTAIGLYHMGARWYDPAIGVWTQPDTIVPNPMDPLALNRYSFVEGNPLKNRDPSGHTMVGPSNLQPSGPYINIAPPLEVDQTQITIAIQSLLTTPVNVGGPVVGPCCITTAPTLDRGPAIQTSLDDIQPGIFAARGSARPRQLLLPGFESSHRRTDYPSTKAYLDALYDEARMAIKGSGNVPGTKRHKYVADIIRSQNDPMLDAELSYVDGKDATYSDKGSVRLDVIEYDKDGNPINIYDFKFGSEGLDPDRIEQLRQGLGQPDIPVMQIGSE